jgi:hypothetical protein
MKMKKEASLNVWQSLEVVKLNRFENRYDQN